MHDVWMSQTFACVMAAKHPTPVDKYDIYALCMDESNHRCSQYRVAKSHTMPEVVGHFSQKSH